MSREFIYEGKAKQIYKQDENVVIYYKDDATAFNGVKKDTINNKGILNNKICSHIYTLLNDESIPTHFIKSLSEREQLCKSVEIIPLEVIVRNYVAGSMSKRMGIDEGFKLEETVFELSYKNDDLNDPFINDSYATSLKLCTKEELDIIYSLADRINKVISKMFDEVGITLIDMKFEFGKDCDGNIILADEITPDTCRLWDKETMKKLDKDRFRRDLGDVEDAYTEILRRLQNDISRA